MASISSVPRRKRRFYRNQDTQLIKHLSKQVEKTIGMKELEKQKIIISLKRRLADAQEDELEGLAVRIFEQKSVGCDNSGEVIVKEISKVKQNKKKELSSKDADAIAESIYNQLKEKQEVKKMFDKFDKKDRKAGKRRGSEPTDLLDEDSGSSRRKRKKMKELGAFALSEPNKISNENSSDEVKKIKEELSLGLGVGGEEDDTFKELEELSSEDSLSSSDPGDDFSMDGFSTDLDQKKKKKKK